MAVALSLLADGRMTHRVKLVAPGTVFILDLMLALRANTTTALCVFLAILFGEIRHGAKRIRTRSVQVQVKDAANVFCQARVLGQEPVKVNVQPADDVVMRIVFETSAPQIGRLLERRLVSAGSFRHDEFLKRLSVRRLRPAHQLHLVA